MDQRFKVITPVYNAQEWIGKCIESVKSQTHENFIQVIVDDCSTDTTVIEAKSAIGDDPRFVLIERKENTGTLHGHVLAGEHDYRKDDIFVHLDGDDWFSDGNVFERLNGIYEDEDIWCTYGNYKTTDGEPSVCVPIKQNYDKALALLLSPPSLNNDAARRAMAHARATSNIRLYLCIGWIFSQVRSFRAKLWKGINDKDLRASDGSYLAVADVAVFIPVLEMAGLDRVKFVPEVQMIYNRETPINDDKVNRKRVIAHAHELANKEPKQQW